MHIQALLCLLLVDAVATQPVAGPSANPQPRMNCPTAGAIRADDENCVPVETYFSTGSNHVYWVSNTSGSDSNPGTSRKPWRTISRATRAGVLRPGDAVIIRGGIYRESIRNKEAGVSGKRITFAAYPGERVVITGADTMNSGWVQSGDLWRHAWTQPLPAFTKNGTVERRPEFRREMVIVDGKVLRPVYSRGDVVPGTFYVEGTDESPKAIYMRLPQDDPPVGHMIEISHRSALFLPKGAREDWCGAKFGWYRLVGLTFRHAANNGNWAAICSGWEGSLLEENTVEWTNGTGINLQGQNNVIRGNRANDNGMRGIGGRCQKCRIEYNETSRNNWKGYSVSYGAAGIKLIYSNGNIIRHHLSAGNYATGVWLDVHNRDNTIENCLILNNMARGILLEFDTIRTLVTNNVIVGTNLAGHEGSGLQSQAASHNTIAHNTIISNKGFGIWIRTDQRAEDGYNRIYNNLLVANAAGDAKGHSEIRIDVESPGHARTNVLDGNLYWRHGATSNTFIFRDVDGVSYRGSDLIEWQRMTGSDSNASVLDPARPHVEDPQSTDGWRLVPLSQAVKRGVRLPKDVHVPIDIHHFLRPGVKADVGAHQRADVSHSAKADDD